MKWSFKAMPALTSTMEEWVSPFKSVETMSSWETDRMPVAGVSYMGRMELQVKSVHL
jgi:hypothetical protein